MRPREREFTGRGVATAKRTHETIGAKRRCLRPLTAALTIAVGTMSASTSHADEGGVIFWVPGTFGSLAAVPASPGWSFASVFYYTSVNASGDIAAQREFELGGSSRSASASLNIKLNSTAPLLFIDPSYAFASPILGGQLSLDVAAIVGGNSTNLNGTLTSTIGPITTARSGSIGDSVAGFGDLYPKATMRWNAGVNNYMVYMTGDIPVGNYSSTRLSNLGIGHGAIDGGAGYTYFDQTAGHEFSAVGGLTYNLVNPSTNYQNGIDWHVDWGASQFLSQSVFVGAVGYFYGQLTADKGSLPILGPIESRVIGIGPQVGFIFPIGSQQAFLGFKAYKEFDNHDRPDGWNAWVTFSVSLSPQAPVTQPVVAAKY